MGRTTQRAKPFRDSLPVPEDQRLEFIKELKNEGCISPAVSFKLEAFVLSGLKGNLAGTMYFPQCTTPILDSLVKQDAVWYSEENGWAGRASDGQEVHLGETAIDVESYLKHRPTPSMW